MKRMAISEASIQSAIVDWLRFAGFLVFEFAKPGTHGPLRGSVPTGMPDILALKGGRYVWLEVKTPQGKLTQPQAKMALLIEADGGEVHVVRSLEDAIEVWSG